MLRQREREMAEAEEARRRRVTVSIDLLGRKVVMVRRPGTWHPGAAQQALARPALLLACSPSLVVHDTDRLRVNPAINPPLCCI